MRRLLSFLRAPRVRLGRTLVAWSWPLRRVLVGHVEPDGSTVYLGSWP